METHNESHNGILDRVSVAARVVVHRSSVAARELGKVLETGAFEAGGAEVCELEAGSVCVARGRIVRRGGAYCFRVTEIAGEDKP